MAQYGFHFDSSRCTGCKTCELVCKDYHDLGPAILFRRIYDYEGGTWTKTKEDAWEKTAFNYHVSISCNHCDSPACVENCPTGAMQKDEATGLVNTDPNVCIGCGTCRNSCPYDAPRIDASAGVCRKCDGCLARVRDGKEPMCVGSCPLRALEFGPIEELREKYGDCAQVPPMAAPATRPNIVIGTCQAVDSETYNLDEGYVANPLEVE